MQLRVSFEWLADVRVPAWFFPSQEHRATFLDVPRLIIFGAGGCAGDILRIARNQFETLAVVADDPCGDLLGIPVQATSIVRPDDHLLVALGDGAARRRIIERFPANKLASIIAPTATVGDGVVLGEGASLSDYAMITSRSQIGTNLQMNVKTTIGHNCLIGKDVTIGPGATICSYVEIGDGALIGTGAIIPNGKPGRPRRIGAGARISAGAVVLHDVSSSAIVAGNPARRLREFLRELD